MLIRNIKCYQNTGILHPKASFIISYELQTHYKHGSQQTEKNSKSGVTLLNVRIYCFSLSVS